MSKEPSPQTIHLKDYQEPEYVTLETDLTFDIRDGSTEVSLAGDQ